MFEWLKLKSYPVEQEQTKDSVDAFSHFGENELTCGLVEGAALSVVPSRQRLQK